jgi:hypothetical protein
MTLTNPIVEDIRRVVGDAQMAGRVLNIRAEAALLRFEHPTEPCLIEEIADALDLELVQRTRALSRP